MKKALVFVVVGLLLASAGMALAADKKAAAKAAQAPAATKMGVEWLYATGVAFNMKMGGVHEIYVGTDLASLMYGAFPIIAGYQYDIPFMASKALTPYICVGGNIALVVTPVVMFSGGGNVGVGIDYAVNDKMSVFADGGIAITYVPPMTFTVGSYTFTYGGGLAVGPSIKGGVRFAM